MPYYLDVAVIVEDDLTALQLYVSTFQSDQSVVPTFYPHIFARPFCVVTGDPRGRPWGLEAVCLFHAQEPLAGNHQMIQYFNTHDLSGLYESFCQLQIFTRGRDIPTWMIV